MSLSGYAEQLSCEPGELLRFHLLGTGTVAEGARVTVFDVPTGLPVISSPLDGPVWTLAVPGDWPSSLYRAAFSSRGDTEPDGPDADVHFVVRAARPGATAPILVSVPFTTWQAYNRSGEPGQSLYYTEEPTRAAAVSFDRPGGGPPPERWEHGLMQWLPRAGYRVEYCANTDLHGGDELLAAYRLLVVNGHDEYWSGPMRDAVELFAARGGNVAFFAANTCWWQIRLEDGGRTMVCYRDAVADPMSAIDPRQVTVEWSSAPVNRPENSMTGVSFRRGAGTWGPYMARMREESYRVRFADHWVFAGTGLADGDKFAHGALGYETDAAEFEEIDGVPRVTGRDGTPSSFVVLATADLSHWRRYGQGGDAVMGVFDLGAGTVFNAATVNWGAALDDPVVDQITRNVLDRLSRPSRPRWEVIGSADTLVALGACEGTLFGVTADGALCAREYCGQNLPWHRIDTAPGVIGLASPREAAFGMPVGLYAVTADGRLRYRDPVRQRSPWCDLATTPPGTLSIASVDAGIFAATAAGELWHLPVRLLAEGPVTWTRLGASATAGATATAGAGAGAADLATAGVTALASAGASAGVTALATAGVTALATLGCRLYAIGRDDTILTRMPFAGPAEWTPVCDAGGAHTLTGYAGMLIIASDQLRRRPPT